MLTKPRPIFHAKIIRELFVKPQIYGFTLAFVWLNTELLTNHITVCFQSACKANDLFIVSYSQYKSETGINSLHQNRTAATSISPHDVNDKYLTCLHKGKSDVTAQTRLAMRLIRAAVLAFRTKTYCFIFVFKKTSVLLLHFYSAT